MMKVEIDRKVLKVIKSGVSDGRNCGSFPARRYPPDPLSMWLMSMVLAQDVVPGRRSRSHFPYRSNH